jgi:acetoin utilization deacetylase AcuC-like enzyme
MEHTINRLRIVHHEAYEVDIGPHVFPTRKYRLVRDRLLAEGTIADTDFLRPAPASDDDVALVHTPEFLDKLRQDALSVPERLVLEVPFSPELREAMWLCAGGSILTGRLALERGIAVHLGGGFHHAFPDHGEGFCLINDVAIAIRALLRDGAIGRAAVIDVDVHHGNGTAAIFAAQPDVFTFSIHQEHNYPAWKPPSDLDLGMENGTNDGTYLAALEHHLPSILGSHRPDLVFYLAGADPYEQDQLGGLGLTIEGLRRRDALVLSRCADAGIPTVVTLAGGYAISPDDTVEIHCNSIREAKRRADSVAG